MMNYNLKNSLYVLLASKTAQNILCLISNEVTYFARSNQLTIQLDITDNTNLVRFMTFAYKVLYLL